MILAAAALLFAAIPEDIEASTARHVALSYERVGRRTPVQDEVLSSAARELARGAIRSHARAVAELVPLTEALSFSGGWDPSPRAFVLKAKSADQVLHLLGERSDFATEAASHVGISAAVEADASAVVILLADRRAELQPFPRHYPKAVSPRRLCGALEPPLERPEVLVTVPRGRVERAVLSQRAGRRFCAQIPLPGEGRYTVELLGRGPRGPEIAALFFVDVGARGQQAQGSGAPEPDDPALARSEIVARMNALRKALGTAPVQIDPQLSAIAQAYSERMGREGFFGHVAPEGATLLQRLRAAGYAFRGAGENLGRAEGPLAAHFGIEHSPGHRLNLVDPRWSRVGIGIAEVTVEGRRDVFLSEIFVDSAGVSQDPLADAYAVVARRRAELRLPALRRSPALERLAVQHARRALAMDETSVEAVDPKIHERVFAALSDAVSAGVDLFVGDSVVPPTDTRAAADARNAYIGIGAVKGDSAKYGRGHYWIAVIYAAAR